MSGILCSTYNTSSNRANLSFDVSSSVLGNIHIQNGAGSTSGSANQAAITFMGSVSSNAQAGIYVLNDNSNGTSMGFATTNSYAVGPQLFMTASNNGVVNFPRANPTVQGNAVLHAGNFNSYAPTLTGGGASGTWGISITGNAATAGGFTPSQSTIANGIVVRDVNGYIFGNYINMTDDGNPGGGSAITSFITKQGDNYYRSVSPSNAMVSIRGVASGTWGINITGSAGSASSVAWAAITGKPSNIYYYQGFTLDANTMDTNASGFTYSVNAPYTGPIERIGDSNYSLQFNAAYSGGGTGIAFRTRNGDAGTFNTWRVLLNDANYTAYAVPIRVQSNWNDNTVINNVVGLLSWKNYGNGHVIFDASQGTSPSGGGVSQTNATYAWTATYPTLMGWNGSGTYGVRVDSARVSDNTTGNAATVGGRSVGNSANNIGYFDANGNLYINNPESYSGEVRLGAAWGRGGIFAANGLSLSTNGSFIDFVFGNVVPTTMNSSGAITFNNYNTGGIRVTSSGTSSSGAAFAIQQVTAEGWTGIYVDYEPYTGWGLYHDNPANYFLITSESATGSFGAGFTVPSRSSGNRTAYVKHRFDQNNGEIIAGGMIYSYASVRAPIFYDSNDTGYYLDPNGSSVLSTVYIAGTLRNNGAVSDNSTFGLYFDSSASTAYAIYREAGAWSFPYPDLRIAFHTGIKFGANASYKGMNFYTDYDMSGLVMSVNNADYNTGGIYVHGTAYASAYYETSDARVKTILEDNSRVKGIELIKPKLYQKDGKTEFGYIAQDFLDIMPYAVNNDNVDGMYSLVYREVHTAKIAMVEDEVDVLKRRVSELEIKLQKYEA
jgi:hypothetical protein